MVQSLGGLSLQPKQNQVCGRREGWVLSHLSLPGDFGKHQGGEGKGCTISKDQALADTGQNPDE